MALVKVRLEAVRYLAAKAKYEDDDVCKNIIRFVTYKRTGVGVKNIITNPYLRNGNSPYILNKIADMLSNSIGDNWYKLVVSDEGINFILMKLQCDNTVEDENILSGVTLTDEYLLTFFKQQETLFVNKNN